MDQFIFSVLQHILKTRVSESEEAHYLIQIGYGNSEKMTERASKQRILKNNKSKTGIVCQMTGYVQNNTTGQF